jgi:hypothetical protein
VRDQAVGGVNMMAVTNSYLGNSKVEGVDEDLSLDGVKYNIALSVFFIPYILFGKKSPNVYLILFIRTKQVAAEIPSNWMLSKTKRPSIFLGAMIVCWGIIKTLSGVVQKFAGFCVTRLLLGFFEYVNPTVYNTSPYWYGDRAGFFPGAVYLVVCEKTVYVPLRFSC